MILKPFYATLYSVLQADDTYLPLVDADKARLMAIVPEGEEIILDINDGKNQEGVVATRQCDQFILTRGNPAYKFPKGTSVQSCLSPGVLMAVEWLVCNHNCCEGDCPCEPVTSAGAPVLPAAVSGQPWAGAFIFLGDTPMNFSVTGAPSWVTVSFGANYVSLAGTGTGAGTWTIAVAATNCAGATAVEQAVLTLT